jgi:hypothetical protein
MCCFLTEWPDHRRNALSSGSVTIYDPSFGAYSHWGLARVHGNPAADKAMAQAHRRQLSQVLSTPLRDLLQDVERSTQGTGLAPKVYVERLRKQGVELLPEAPQAGVGRHLNSVLHALSILAQNRTPGAIRRAS